MTDRDGRDPRPLRLDGLPPEILASIVAYCEGGSPTDDDDNDEEEEEEEDPNPATMMTTTTTTIAAIITAGGTATADPDPSPPPPPARDVATIRSLRLTNRLLAALAAPHLVRLLDVAMTPASLARLDAVSRHPTIAPGVRRLRVSLAFYPAPRFADDPPDHQAPAPLFAADPANFARFALRALCIEGSRGGRDALIAKEDLAKLKARVQEWLRVPSAVGPLPPFLERAFAEYNRRCEEYATVRYGFGPAVARAAARMRHATSLEVNDKVPPGPRGQWHERHVLRREGGDALVDERALAELLELPMPWEETTAYARAEAADHPVEALRELLADLGRLSVRLTRLVVSLTPPARYHRLMCADNERGHIASAVRGVRAAGLAVRPLGEIRGSRELPAWPPRGPAELAALGSFASAALASEALELLDLDFGALRRENQDLWALDTVLGDAPRGWGGLRRLALRGACLGAADLGALVGERLTSLRLCTPHLAEGSWAEALEMLRGRADPARREAGETPLELCALTSPTGGEIETMTGAQYYGIFSPPRGWAFYEAQMSGDPVLSPAVRFVSHLQDENPVRAVL